MEVPYELEDQQQQHQTPNKVQNYDNSYYLQHSLSMDNNNNNSNNDDNNTSFVNGENPIIIDELLSQDGARFEFKEPIKRDDVINGETNGFTKEQNGGGVEYPTLPESNGGEEETDIGAVTSSLSSTSETTTVGLKNVGSLFNETLNRVNGTPFDYSAENMVNKTLILSGQNEIVEADGSKEVEVGEDVYDVEKVIHNQESHDLICPHCNRDITKRVIIKRRKRKIDNVLKGLEDTSIKPGDEPNIKERKLEKESSRVKGSSDGRIEAISCFSCFSVFVPKGDGFLWWRFTSKPAATLQTDNPFTGNKDIAESANEDQTETTFASWILTCCQPYHAEKPVLKPDPKPPSTLEDGTQESSKSQSSIVPETDPELPPSSEPGEETTLPPTHELPVPETPGEGEDSRLWFLTCCQPSENKSKLSHAPKQDKQMDPTYQHPTLLEPDTPSSETLSVPKRLTAIKPVKDTSKLPSEEQPLLTPTEVAEKESSLWFLTCCQPASEGKKQKHPEKPDAPALQGECPPPQPPSKDRPLTTVDSTTPDHANTYYSSKPSSSTKLATETPKPHETQPLVKPAEVAGTSFPFWFVTCCQPSTDGNEPKLTKKQEKTGTSHADGTQVKPRAGSEIQHHDKISPGQSDGTSVQHHDTEPPSLPYEDMPVPPMSEPPEISETRQIILPKPLYPIQPSKDVSSSSDPEAPSTPPKGDVIVPIPDEQPDSQHSATSSDPYRTGPTPSIEEPLLEHQRETARGGVPGPDIIKAIVYGGLLECITSLSVITSAAGGDATTLNIVALGLANVFAGLVVLLHNLRVLKHEHGTERYKDQLGRPGHFLLHAIIAVLSYLIFGLMSPLIYGFAFRKSDNKDYKLATMAASSLLCIAILSIGKAYVRSSPKAYFQTFFYYISMAFMVSGLGYVAGDVINMLLKKLGVFDSRMGPVDMRETWASY